MTDPWMQQYVDAARRVRAEAEPERMELAERRRTIADDLAARRVELAHFEAHDGTEDASGSLLMPGTSWLRARVEDLAGQLETIERRERELFKRTRSAMAAEYGLGLGAVETWAHLGAWQRWFDDTDERDDLRIAAEERGEREGDIGAIRREASRQIEEYGIIDSGRWQD